MTISELLIFEVCFDKPVLFGEIVVNLQKLK